MGVRVPEYAAENAQRGLKERDEFPESQRPVLSQSEAREKGINSGVTSAQTLIRSDNISDEMATRIYSYLSRNQADGERSLVARRVWGGDESGRFEDYLERKLNQD
jgi:hypothetical protein